jgi:gluconolactonase
MNASKSITGFLAALLCSLPAANAQDTLNFPVLGETIRYDERLDEIIPLGMPLHVICSGFEWTEGPVWIAGEGDEPGYLLFSDIPNNAIMRWDEGKGVSLYMRPAGYTGVAEYGYEPGSNGLLLDPQGRLVCCEHGDRRVSVVTENGGKRTLVDNYEGRRLNSPNDAIYASNGDLYFTDPPYGLPMQADDPRRELDFCGVYRLSADGELTLLTDEMTRPNGIGLSPDEKTLYVAQSDPEAPVVMQFPVMPDGTIGEGSVLYDFSDEFAQGLPGLPDGLSVDVHGNVFATAPGGLYIFAADGTLLGRISTGERTANCCFGGPDKSMLYLATDMYVTRIQTTTEGL